MLRKCATAVLLLGAISVVAIAQQPSDSLVRITNPRDVAVGGSHIAHVSGFDTLFTNPAGLVWVDPQFKFSDLTFRFTGPVFSLASVVAQGAGGDFAALLSSTTVQNLLSSIYANVNLTGPLAFGYTGPGLGFAVFNDTDVLMQTVGATSIEARLSERVLFTAGYGFQIPLPEAWDSGFALGFGLKGFVRGGVALSTSILSLATLIESVDASLLTGAPFRLTSGIGIDLGIVYRWRDVLSVGVTGNNLYTPVAVLNYESLGGFLDGSVDPGAPSYSSIAQDITFGVAFTPSLGRVERYISDLALLLDYRDIFDFWLDTANAENIVLKFGFGLEARLLEVLSLRAGFNEGLFTAGLGINMGFVELNAAMYGAELSLEPGLRPVYNLVFGLEFHQ